MGKVLIIMIVLITAIFVTITLTVQERAEKVPETIEENLNELRAKDLGAYALNYAIKQYRDDVVIKSQIPLVDSLTSLNTYSLPISNFIVLEGEGTINSIQYAFVDLDDTNQKEYLHIETVVTFSTSYPNTSEVILTVDARPLNEEGHWGFDEGSGSTADDDNPNDNNGTLVNTDTTTVWVDGQVDGAIHLDGTNDRVDLESGVSSTYDDQMTVCCWAKMDPSFLDWGTLIAEQTNEGVWPICWTLRARVFDIWFFKTVKYAFDIVASSGVKEVKIEKNNWQMDIYAWHFIVGSYDGTYSETQAEIAIQIYDEDYKATKIVDKWSRRDSTNVVTIGGRETNVWWFGAFTCIDATLDEVRLFSSVLSQAEIDDIFTGNFPETNNIIYWKE
jgi:hypothetical protein